VAAEGEGERDTESWLVGGALAALLLGVVALALFRRVQSSRHPRRDDLADVPLVVDRLVKTYGDGHRAVDDVSWRAERGQVVGLLGPNGAGKTTTMRMMLGLISPDSGAVYVLGHRITPGTDVLGQVGALVEGPGFLPHLTGRQNLQAYWRATGRPESEAGFEEVLDVAALGGALDRPVRTYSHGMKQRLGIAQAMLGKPDVLFLDEPTNGLDPPQIAAMRPILQAYAATGRTVVVSSHMLSEVEMTCSHVVVMHAGRVITTGRVDDLVASEDTTVIDVPTAPSAEVVEGLRALRGVREVEVIDEGDIAKVTIVAPDLPRVDVVRAALDAGLDVLAVGSRRHLEEVFLGVIAGAQGNDAAAPDAGSSLIERLRQVRAR
jgi:ABC-2 type transport system ATP-binding protein